MWHSVTSHARWRSSTPNGGASCSVLRASADHAASGLDHRLVFRFQVALGGLGLALAGTAVVTAAGSVHRAPRGSDQVVIAGQLFTYPEVNVAAAVLLVLAALGAAVLTTIV